MSEYIQINLWSRKKNSVESGLKLRTLKSTDPRFNPSFSTDYFVTWDLLLNLDKPQYPHLQCENFNTIYLKGRLLESTI